MDLNSKGSRMKTCKCGINRLDCDYHRPARGVPRRVGDARDTQRWIADFMATDIDEVWYVWGDVEVAPSPNQT